jgi:precorrin-8X/cobalt-precorrin-8 methylmutase
MDKESNKTSNMEKTAVIIFGHGSPVPEANRTLFEVVDHIREKGNYDVVQAAFLEFEHPNFQEAIDIIFDKGKKKVIIHPYFLYMGTHVRKDLPQEVDSAKRRYPGLEIKVAKNLGCHEKIVEVAVERIEEVRSREVKVERQGIEAKFRTDHSKLQALSQHPIEAESFRIIGKEIDESGFNPMELSIVKRVIHATADFDFTRNLIFSQGAIEKAIDSIKRGRDIITDVRMVEIGINKSILEGFGGSVKCFSRDKDVIEMADREKITKTSASLRKAAEHMDGSIVAIGNAPTALSELIRLTKGGRAKPSVIIGVPVGFVGAAKSKEELIREELQYITCKGRKGGSTVAVAIVNALLILASERTK